MTFKQLCITFAGGVTIEKATASYSLGLSEGSSKTLKTVIELLARYPAKEVVEELRKMKDLYDVKAHAMTERLHKMT